MKEQAADPKTWWLEYGDRLPVLSKLARDRLPLPGGMKEFESVFPANAATASPEMLFCLANLPRAEF